MAKLKPAKRDPETEYGAWPKERTLIIGAKTSADLIRAATLVKRFEEDVRKHNQKSGRLNGIIYSTQEYNDPVYVWYTRTQITIHFED